MAPPGPKSELQSLPPILRKRSSNTMPTYSKAAQGLFAFPLYARHFYRVCNFTGSRVETVTRPLYHSCGSELTRQGISLISVIQYLLYWQLPIATACRHADRTISSSSNLDVRRMVSEDSDQINQSFLLIVPTPYLAA